MTDRPALANTLVRELRALKWSDDDAIVLKCFARVLAEHETALEPLERIHDYLLSARGVNAACRYCDGLGVQTYANTSMWHRSVGGSMLTVGVCDTCWGSGDATKPWPSWRQAEHDRKAAEARCARLEHDIEIRKRDFTNMKWALDAADATVEALLTEHERLRATLEELLHLTTKYEVWRWLCANHDRLVALAPSQEPTT